MPTIIQCKFCNLPFHSVGGKICQNCLQKIDEDFTTIRDYIYDHPGRFDVDSICEATDVKKSVVLHLIREGRLEINDYGQGGGAFSCSVCFKPISSGTMCDECKSRVSGMLDSAVSKPEAPAKKPAPKSAKNPKMHVRRNG